MRYLLIGWVLLAAACSDDKGTSVGNNSSCTGTRCIDIDAGQDTSTMPDTASEDCVANGCADGKLCNANTGACVACQFDTECGANGLCNDNGGCECAVGFHDCGGTCVSDNDVATCGTSCTPCQAPTNGTAVCEGGVCGFTCEAPLVPNGSVCGACTANAECTNAAEPKCDAGNCVACSADADCSHITGLPFCSDTGSCVACKIDDDCNGGICLPDGSCSSVQPGSVAVCGECTVSLECEAGSLCVPMQFKGAAYGNYCLKEKGTEDCPSPYVFEITRASVGGDQSTFCSVNEASVTCEAVLDFGSLCPTGKNEECGKDGVDDGRCEPVGFDSILQCTYSCSSGTQCPETDELGCISADYCGGF